VVTQRELHNIYLKVLCRHRESNCFKVSKGATPALDNKNIRGYRRDQFRKLESFNNRELVPDPNGLIDVSPGDVS
jgi:hypothetical protein